MLASLIAFWFFMITLLLAKRASRRSSRATSPAAGASSPHARSVFINGARIGDDALLSLDRANGLSIANGRYWYDGRAGLWGSEGRPPQGRALPGLGLGGSLRADASGGNTGVFVNGREAHWLEVLAARQVTLVLPGRYWLDAQGNGGFEGGPALWNLNRLGAAAAGTGDRSWSYRHPVSNISAGGDGNGNAYFNCDSGSVMIGD